ncbi:MAG: trehalose synthase, partial [Flavobacteriales bacterium CG11_big_fil_rev_8_21_14_0_20_35_7]
MSKKDLKTTLLQPLYNFEDSWEELLNNKAFVKAFLSDVLEDYIVKQRWYAGKSSKLKYIELSEYFKIQNEGEVYYGLILELDFVEAFYQHYFLPIAFVSDENFANNDRILSISIKGQKGFIIDAINLESFRKLVFERILNAEPNDKTRVQYHKSVKFININYESSRYMGLEQSNTSIVYNEKYVLKFFRRIYADKNPDYEMSRFLSEKKDFKNTPSFLGSINIVDADNSHISIALLQDMIQNQGDAWDYMLTEFHQVFLNIDTKRIKIDSLPIVELYKSISISQVPPQIIDWVGLNLFLKTQILALRTAEMHITLGSEFEETAFTPAR